MKPFFFSISLLTCCSSNLFAQTTTPKTTELPKFYLGIGTGINNHCGIAGLKLDARLGEQVLAGISGGLGSWGYKTSFSVVYQKKNTNGWCPAITISRASGLDSLQVQLDVIEAGVAENKKVSMELKPVNLIAFSMQRQWISAKNNRAYIELGYAVPFDFSPYKVRKANTRLAETGKAAMDFTAPGGMIIGFTYSFAL